MSLWRRSLVVRPVADDELDRFRALLAAHHWLGFRLSGQVVRYVAVLDGRWAALAGFGSAALTCTVREQFLGWDTELKRRRLPLLASSQRLCVLPEEAPPPSGLGRAGSMPEPAEHRLRGKVRASGAGGGDLHRPPHAGPRRPPTGWRGFTGEGRGSGGQRLADADLDWGGVVESAAVPERLRDTGLSTDRHHSP